MWKSVNHFNFFKVLLIVCLSFLLFSCKGRRSGPVTGDGHGQWRNVFSKVCSAGSIKINVRNQSIATGHRHIYNEASVNPGDEVIIAGQITNASLCYQGSATFCCEGRASAVSNRIFECHAGSVSPSFVGGALLDPTYTSCPTGTSYSTGHTQTSGITYPHPNTLSYPHTTTDPYSHYQAGRPFIGGQVFVDRNSQRFDVQIQLGGPPVAPRLSCSINLSCH